LRGPGGPLAIATWEPPAGTTTRFCALHVQAAFEEMNKSRRMVALQARSLARLGGLVAVVDVRGTGDSVGDHDIASWSGWRDDVVAGWRWLTEQATGPAVLWALRLGALLAVDVVARHDVDPALLVLWQPVPSGRSYFNQFLRLAAAQQLADGAGTGSPASPRARLAAGGSINVGGYGIDPSLVAGADAVDLGEIVPRMPAIWREATIVPSEALTPASTRIVDRWRSLGAEVDAQPVVGPSFWLSQEIAEAPRLVESTSSAIEAFLQRQPSRSS
jgi:exosortase A-associated hydrolase 2